MPDNIRKGKAAEVAAGNYLRKLGYKILEKNFRTKLGEIDIIAGDGETLVFVEVKSRNTLGFGLPQEAVGSRKIRKITMTATAYIKMNKIKDCDMRFDVVCVMPQGSVEHIKSAFFTDGGYRF